MVALSEQYAQVHNATVDTKLFDTLCKLLPAGAVRSACDGFFNTYGGEIIELFAEKHTPDVICTTIKFCSGQCHLFPAPKEGLAAAAERAHATLGGRLRFVRDLPKICNVPGIKELCNIINNFANNHDPIDDLDQVGVPWAGRHVKHCGVFFLNWLPQIM